MAKLKIINQDLTKSEIDLPEGASIDFSAMGVLNSEEVTTLKTNALSEGFTKGETSLQTRLDEANGLKTKAESDLTAFRESLKGKDAVAVQNEERLSSMQSSLEALQKNNADMAASAKVADFQNMMGGVVSNANFVGGGRDIFINAATSQRINGGNMFVGESGGEVTAGEFFSEWKGTETGKALIKSDQQGGAGSGPGAGQSNPNTKPTSLTQWRKEKAAMAT